MSNPITSTREEHERQLVRSFFLPQGQERYLELLAKPRRRDDATEAFAHFKHLDTRWTVAIAPSSQNPSDIFRILRAKGAPEVCYALSENRALDGKELSLSWALEKINGRAIGTFLSCLPGELAYFENEDQRCILERRTKA
jgi:hypothetical protein